MGKTVFNKVLELQGKYGGKEMSMEEFRKIIFMEIGSDDRTIKRVVEVMNEFSMTNQDEQRITIKLPSD